MRELTVGIVLATLLSCVWAESGYLMTTPKVFQPGTEEKLCFTFFDVDGDVHVTATLKTKPPTEQEHVFRNGVGDCMDFPVPVTSESSAKLKVSGRAHHGSYTFSNTTKVSIIAPGTVTFIQTDKPQYKPGQTVMVRVLSLDANLKPTTDDIHAIWIEDPNGIRMAQWLTMVTQKGLVSLDFRTSDEPVLGTWTIMVQLHEDSRPEKKTFKIDEYVLPKYEISITPPSWVPITAQTIEGEVCARYTYGKPVKGLVSVRLCISETYRSKRRPCHEIKEETINGCFKFSGDASVLELDQSRWSIWGAKLQITASVEEEGTGVVLNATDESASVQRYLMKFSFKPHTPDYFKPSLPFSGKLLVTDGGDNPKPDQQVHIHGDNFDLHATSNSAGEVEFTLPTSNLSLSDGTTISANVEGGDTNYDYSRETYRPYRPSGYHSIKPWFSPSGSYIQMAAPGEGSVACDQEVEIPVTYTTVLGSRFTFFYQVISRGNIVYRGQTEHHFTETELQQSDAAEPQPTGSPLPHKAEFVLRVPVSHRMSPLAHVLLYYVREDSEVVADSITLTVQRCLENDVSLAFVPDKVYPGGETMLKLRASPESLCSVGVVDKSVHVLGGNNQVTQDKVFKILSGYDIDENSGPYMPNEYCEQYLENNSPPIPGAGPPGSRRVRGRGRARGGRAKRSSMPWYGGAYSEQFDAIKAFKSSGMVVLSDRTLETRVCREHEMILRRKMMRPLGMPGPGGAGGAGGGITDDSFDGETVERKSTSVEAAEKTVDIRTYFPETWLWELYDMGEHSERELKKEVPHTITDWVGSAFCTEHGTGFGVSETVTLRAFQPFFLSFTLPYSAVRGETLRLPVSVFNYLDKCIVVEISMESTDELGVEDPSRKVCVCGSETETVYFMVTARDVGMVNLTASATSVMNEDWRCNNNLIEALDTVVRDAATRELLIEPEGKREEYTISKFICPKEGETVQEIAELSLPSDGLVEDSAAGTVSVIGDVMGPTLSNLDSLIRLPMGCGEQNMLLFAPNIFVMQYLEATDQDTSDIRTKALEHMETGYQRELTYRHSDGSYSAFGESDESGSTWLTAFVVRCFAQARDYIFIDDADLKTSIDWFRSKQKENGCFMQVGRVLHKDMKGGLSSGDSDIGLTAYVLIALIDAGVPTSDTMVREALACLTVPSDDTYTAALVTYVFSKLGDSYNTEKDKYKSLMESLATKEDGMQHWTKQPSVGTTVPPTEAPFSFHQHRTQSADVEMTSYTLMAYLHMKSGASLSESVSTGLPMVRWLSAQRNAQGGFSSTQDTVVALQALADYATMVYSDDVDVRVAARLVMTSGQEVENMHITPENSLLLHQQDVIVPSTVEYSVSGTGCALLQANVRYHHDPSATKTAENSFVVKVQVEPRREVTSHCRWRYLNVCVKYDSDEPSNMAVVDIKMQTGWIPDKMSLKQMKKDGVKNLMRQEVEHNRVHLYFDELINEFTCMRFLVEEDMEVKDPKEAFVHVYDYYNTDISHVENYGIRSTCGTKEELAHLTPDEYDDLIDSGFTGQVRQPNENPFGGEEEEECPRCYDEVPDTLQELLCGAVHAYKGVVKRGKVRILSDQRAKEKVPFSNVVYVKEDKLGFTPASCNCDLLTEPLSASKNENTRVLLVTNSDLSGRERGKHTEYSLEMGADSIIMPLTNDRAVRNAVRRCSRTY